MIKSYFPSAKIGYGYIAVNSGGWEYNGFGNINYSNSKNYFTTYHARDANNRIFGVGGIIFTPTQAYAIDNKIDDGLPQYGRVIAMTGGEWAFRWNIGGHAGCDSPKTTCGPVTTNNPILTSASIYTCYDNDYTNNAGGIEHYSTNPISISNINCGLSWEFQ